MDNILHRSLGTVKPLVNVVKDGKRLILGCNTNDKAYSALNEVTKTSRFVVLYGNEGTLDFELGYTSLKEFKIRKNHESAYLHPVKAVQRATEVFYRCYVNDLENVNFSKLI